MSFGLAGAEHAKLSATMVDGAVEHVRFVHPSDPVVHAGLQGRPAVDPIAPLCLCVSVANLFV